MRVADDPVLGPLDRGNLRKLGSQISGPETSVDHPDAALFGENRRHGGPRDGVHVGRHDGPAERDVLGEPGAQIDDAGIAPGDDPELG